MHCLEDEHGLPPYARKSAADVARLRLRDTEMPRLCNHDGCSFNCIGAANLRKHYYRGFPSHNPAVQQDAVELANFNVSHDPASKSPVSLPTPGSQVIDSTLTATQYAAWVEYKGRIDWQALARHTDLQDLNLYSPSTNKEQTPATTLLYNLCNK